MSVQEFGNAQSGSKKGLLVSQLSPSQLEAELNFWQRQVAKYNKSIEGSPANSAQRGSFAKQLDMAMLRAIQTQAVLAQVSRTYQPLPGPELASGKKDAAAASKYRSWSVEGLVSAANSISSSMMPQETEPRSYSLSRATASLLQPVLTKNWTATQSAGTRAPAAETDQRGFQQAIDEAMAGRAPAAATQTPAPRQRVVTTTKGRGGKQTVTVDGKKVVVGSEQWKTIIQEEFGGLWDVYNDNEDVKKVIDKSVKEGWFNDETKLGAALQSTNWYRTTEQSARQYAIRLSSDPATVEDDINVRVENLRTYANENGLSLDDATLRRLATNQLKFGWSDIQSANAVGSEAVALAQAGGTQGMADLRQGATGRKLRETARAFAQKPSDSDIDQWISEIMTGKKSEKQWEDLMRNSAKVQFRSLTPALDRGETVEQATYAYVRQADQTLGSVMDISQIDWSNDKWNKALNYKDEKTGENRPMDLWEWNKYLRSLPEWQETDQAKQAYRNVAYSLAQGFGKMA